VRPETLDDSRPRTAICYAHELAGYESPTNSEAVKATAPGVRWSIGPPVRKALVVAEIMRVTRPMPRRRASARAFPRRLPATVPSVAVLRRTLMCEIRRGMPKPIGSRDAHQVVGISKIGSAHSAVTSKIRLAAKIYSRCPST
jgi:hypothetical protein